MAKKGRKTKFDAELVERVKQYARDGLTEKEMCHNLGINETTFNRWKREKQQFRQVLKESKEIIDAQVVNALLKRALGFEYDEIHDIDAPEGHTHKIIRKMVAPSETACIFWLKNRQRDKWRNADYDLDMSDDGTVKELLAAFKKSKQPAKDEDKDKGVK